MNVLLSPIYNGFQAFLPSGLPNQGGKIYTYLAGTMTPAATYTDNTGSTTNTNPIILNTAGYPPNEIWLPAGQAYKFVITDQYGTNSIASDNIVGNSDINSSNLSASNGSSLVGYLTSASGGIARTLESKNNDIISVLDFCTDAQKADAASTNPVLDLTIPLQNFFNALGDKSKKYIMNGNFRITSNVNITNKTESVIFAQASIISSNYADEGAMLQIVNSPFFKLVGKLILQGGGSATYTTRTNGIGLQISNSTRVNIDSIHTNTFKYRGVSIENGSDAGGGNSSLWGFNFLKATYCGTGIAGSVNGLRQTITNFMNTGSSFSLAQTTTITTINVPSGLRQFDWVRVGANVYVVTNVSTNSFTVFPWVIGNVGDNIDYYIGGALYVRGGDTSCGTVGTLDAQNSSIGYACYSLYPATIDNFVGQFNGIQLMLGRGGNYSMVGGQINRIYTEQGDFDIVRGETNAVSFNISNTDAINFTNCRATAPNDGLNTYNPNYVAWLGLSIGVNGKSFVGRQLYSSSTINVDFSPKRSWIETVKGNTVVASIIDDNPVRDTLLNVTDSGLLVIGTGTNNRPTSTVTIKPPVGGTINGGAADAPVIYNSFYGPTLFYIFKIGVLAYAVQRMDYAFYLSGSATYNPPLLPNGSSVTTTVTVTGAALGDFVDVSFGITLSGITIAGEVSSADTVIVTFTNNTGASVDLASSTLRARVQKA